MALIASFKATGSKSHKTLVFDLGSDCRRGKPPVSRSQHPRITFETIASQIVCG